MRIVVTTHRFLAPIIARISGSLLPEGGRAVIKSVIRGGLASLSLLESRASARRGRLRRTSPRLGSTLLEKEGEGKLHDPEAGRGEPERIGYVLEKLFEFSSADALPQKKTAADLIRAPKLKLTALAAALLLAGCGRKVDSPSPLQPEKPPPTERETVTTERRDQSDAPSVDPLKLQEDAMDALESGDLETAFKLVRAAMSVTPDDPQTIFLMARVLAQRNRFVEAIRMLDDLAEAVPETRLPALGQTAEWSVFQGRWQEAENRYRTLLDEVGDASMIHRMLSQLLLRQGRRLEAAVYLRELCRVGDIDESELRSLLITVHPFSGETATGELEPIGQLGNARYEISQGNWDAALEELEPLSSQRPDEDALRGRIYAHQRDFESLGKWAADAPESGTETTDYWFAMGVYHAHRGDHQAAVKSFCAAVLRDQTDADAYLLMSQSLAELDADAEAQEASKRAKLIQQTQVIGNQVAISADREVQKMSTLGDLLDQLQRPLEALAWHAMRAVYAQSSSAISDQVAMQQLREINRIRLQRLEANDTDATSQFILCGVDLDTL